MIQSLLGRIPAIRNARLAAAQGARMSEFTNEDRSEARSLGLLGQPAAPGWQAFDPGSGGVSTARQACVFLNTYTGAGYWDWYYPYDGFRSVDLKPFGVPANASAAQLSGMLIISMGVDPDICTVGFITKSPAAPAFLGNMTNYAECARVSWGGVRQPVHDVVPLVNGCFDIAILARWASPTNLEPYQGYKASIGGFPAIGLNLQVAGYLT